MRRRGRCLGIQLAGGDLRGNARLASGILVVILDLSIDLARLLGLARGGVHGGELKLCKLRRHRHRVTLGELLIQLDGLGLTAGLGIQLGQGRLAEGRGIAVPATGNLFQSVFGWPVLTGLHIGKPCEVGGELPGFRKVELAGHLGELSVRYRGALRCGVVRLHARRQRLAGADERGLIGLHRLTERGLRLRGAVLIYRVATNQDQQQQQGKSAKEQKGASIAICPVQAVFTGEHELILLPGVAL